MEAESGSEKRSFQLEPFIHQVGGHSSMLQLDKNTICKPFISRELKFYQNSPESLKSFMPEFRGVVEVTFSTDNEGYLRLTAYLPSDYKKPGENLSQNFLKDKNKSKLEHRISMLHKIRICHSGSLLIESDSDDGKKHLFKEADQGKGKLSENLLNPWVIHCHQEQMKKMRMLALTSSQKYMLLENLAAKYEFPCILDLKMGTRPYGDDASMAKRQRHVAKMASTTSFLLGVRIGGIQVYHHDSGHYICHNKYYGRGLTVEGFHQALYHFLHNGNELRKDVLSQLIHKLHKLQDVIQSLNTFRFFTSSLLIIYNSEKHSPRSERNREVNCCSSLHSSFQCCENGNVNKKNTINKKPSSDSASARAYGGCGHSSEEQTLSRQLLGQEQQEGNNQDYIVDIKMIDFAHSTQSMMSGSNNVHVGPDDGYLLGLRSLIAQLKIFQHEN